MPTPCQMGLRDYITWPSYNPHSQIIPHSHSPWRPRFITTEQYFEHSMAQSWWGGGYRASPSRALLPIREFILCSTVSSETTPAWGDVLTQRGQYPLQPSTSANWGQGMLPELGGGPAGRATGQSGHAPAGQSGQTQPGEAVKSVGWHFSLTLLIKIIKHCVGNPEKHPSCSVCRWNPSCVQVPTFHPTLPLPPPDSTLWRL